MATTLPRKALISITSYTGVLFADGENTGLFYIEALHPYEVLTRAGFEVDLASETGEYGIDALSTRDQFLVGSDKETFHNPDHPFNVKLKQLKKASDLRKEDYGVFFASAGHAALYDYPAARNLQTIAENIWARGGVLAATCHGAAIFPGVIDRATSKPVIDGKVVTGFTKEGEVILKVMDTLRAHKVVMIEDAVKKAGGFYSAPNEPFDDYSITAGRIVSGANPASARSAAERSVQVFNQLTA